VTKKNQECGPAAGVENNSVGTLWLNPSDITGLL